MLVLVLELAVDPTAVIVVEPRLVVELAAAPTLGAEPMIEVVVVVVELGAEPELEVVVGDVVELVVQPIVVAALVLVVVELGAEPMVVFVVTVVELVAQSTVEPAVEIVVQPIAVAVVEIVVQPMVEAVVQPIVEIVVGAVPMVLRGGVVRTNALLGLDVEGGGTAPSLWTLISDDIALAFVRLHP
ncbi:hypothetical protein C5167_024897 [Papaver somniferum]|uniref:Uncharacterized protein n=1 Tax=Papaver somniferum TaxID=3469 RepID=A0A4Y7JPV3_PAPSO|nr:hypothetical protein C5167_024897 [Papaver somniferum]